VERQYCKIWNWTPVHHTVDLFTIHIPVQSLKGVLAQWNSIILNWYGIVHACIQEFLSVCNCIYLLCTCIVESNYIEPQSWYVDSKYSNNMLHEGPSLILGLLSSNMPKIEYIITPKILFLAIIKKFYYQPTKYHSFKQTVNKETQAFKLRLLLPYHVLSIFTFMC